MKGLLRQKLENIAGKVLAVATAVGSPLRQSSTHGGTCEGGTSTVCGRGGTHVGEERPAKASTAKTSVLAKECEKKTPDDDDEVVSWEEDGFEEVNHSRLKDITQNLSKNDHTNRMPPAEGATKGCNESFNQPIDDYYANDFDGKEDIRLYNERPTHDPTSHKPSPHLQHQPPNNIQHPPLQSQLNNNNIHQEQSPLHLRPKHLFSNVNINCDKNLQQHHHQPNLHPQPFQMQHHHSDTLSQSPSSEEDNSPTEMNNCRRLIDKPPLVKRLTMGLLRSTDDSRPLVQNTSSPISGSTLTLSDGYANEGICDPEMKLISSKFGDSCRKSLTSVMDKAQLESSCEFDLKKKVRRETSSANSSPKIFAASEPRLESNEQQELRAAPWFQSGLPRAISLEVLSRQSPGAFLVRQSSSKPNCFALSLRVPPPAPKVAHYLILKTSRGYKIKGFTKEFSSLCALITHHSVMPELLPVPLALPRPPQRRHLDDFVSYGSLNDFHPMMSDLNI